MNDLNSTAYATQKDSGFCWAESKKFLESLGFPSGPVLNKRNSMDVKMDFYTSYKRPILPDYTDFIADMLTVTYIQRDCTGFKYDSLYAFGVCTQYYSVMREYQQANEVDTIFNEMMKAIGFNPVTIRSDAERFRSLIINTTSWEESLLLSSTDGELGEIFSNMRSNQVFKFTDASGIGLVRAMELRDQVPDKFTFERWTKILNSVFPARLIHTWNEFCSNQAHYTDKRNALLKKLEKEKILAIDRLNSSLLILENTSKSLRNVNALIQQRITERTAASRCD